MVCLHLQALKRKRHDICVPYGYIICYNTYVQEAENSLRSRTEKFMKLEVVAITDECLDVRSFLLKPHNQSFGLPPYEPGTTRSTHSNFHPPSCAKS